METNVQIPDLSDPRVLRNVTLGDTGYRLLTWDTNKRASTGQSYVGYAFYRPDCSVPLFQGEDYGVSPFDSIDSDEALRGLMAFLTLKEGDTDEEYFENYTEDQLDFAQSEAEDLQYWGMEESFFEDGEEPPPFVDVE